MGYDEVLFPSKKDNYMQNLREIEDLFEALQNLKARDYLKLYQMMYQDLVEHQQLNYFEELKDNFESKGE